MRALRKVLVVDDDPVIARSFDRVLSDKGYAVVTASDGREALNKLGRDEYDVVFTDIKMPGMDGIEVAERVKSRRPWVPVVIITGYGTEANEARAEAAGVSDFLRKPLSPDMIEASARKALSEAKAPVAAAPATEAAAPLANVEAAVPPVAAPQPAAAGGGSALKNIALFIASPFVGLAYILAFPLVGLGMLAWMGVKAAARRPAAEVAAPLADVEATATPVAAPQPAGAGGGSALKNIALFIAAPFVGLAYILAFPLVGLGILAWMGAKAVAKRTLAKKIGVTAKHVGMFIVSPFIGLAYVLLFPFIGLAILAWIGVRALVKR